jgi:hypothetical protein
MKSSKWHCVNKNQPCPICEKPDWCAASADKSVVACRRVQSGAFKTKTDKAGVPVYLHRRDGSSRLQDSAPPLSSAGENVPDRADADTLGSVYSALLAAFPISEPHRASLRSRGLSERDIDDRGYATLPVQGRARVAADLHQRFGEKLSRVPGIVTKTRDGKPYLTIAGAAGILVPVRDIEGRIVAIMVRRDGDAEGPRYTYLSSRKAGGPSPGSPVHVPRGVVGPSGVVRVTEGTLKADIAHALSGLATLGLPGLGATDSAIQILHQLGATTVRLALDNDARDKLPVARALANLAERAAVAGIEVELEVWPGTHKGIDDALASGVAIEVVKGEDARRAIAEILASATPPGPLDRLAEVLAIGGAEGLFRNEELLQELSQIAETNPAEFACCRAQLQPAGVKLRDFDRAIAPLRETIRASRPKPDTASDYSIVGGRIVRHVQTQNGLTDVLLANFACRIVEEVVRDDGVERSVTFAIEGTLQDGTPLPRVEVPADDFKYMSWPVKFWGTRAVVFAGMSIADHLRCAIQLLSGDVSRQTVYTHTGWREIDGNWCYLHAGGAIGSDGPAAGISVSLPDALAKYELPSPPDQPVLCEAVRASLRVLDVAPDHITISLLGGVFRSVLGPCDSAIHLAGLTGTGKSELSALVQQHFGAGTEARHSEATSKRPLRSKAFRKFDQVIANVAVEVPIEVNVTIGDQAGTVTQRNLATKKAV